MLKRTAQEYYRKVDARLVKSVNLLAASLPNQAVELHTKLAARIKAALRARRLASLLGYAARHGAHAEAGYAKDMGYTGQEMQVLSRKRGVIFGYVDNGTQGVIA